MLHWTISEQIRGFFEETVSNTCKLVGDHIHQCNTKGYRVSVRDISFSFPFTLHLCWQSSLQYVFLVGGFGTSPYLKARIEQYISGIERTIQVIKPPDAYAPLSYLSHSFSILKKLPLLGNNPWSSARCLRSYSDCGKRRIRSAYVSAALTLASSPPSRSIPLSTFRMKCIHTRLPGNVWRRTRYCGWLRKSDATLGSALACCRLTVNGWMKGERITDATSAAIEKKLTRPFEKAVTEVWTETLVRCSADVAPTRLGPGIYPSTRFPY